VEILLWLAFPAVATLVAMGWAAWVGRPEREPSRAATERTRQKFAAAVSKPLPARLRRVPPAPIDRSSGVAVRRTSPAARRNSAR
jgi:hypothetical protein